MVQCGSSHPYHQYVCITFSLHAVHSLVNLGVTYSSDGTYSEHMTSLAQKGRRLAGKDFGELQGGDVSFRTHVYKTCWCSTTIAPV